MRPLFSPPPTVLLDVHSTHVDIVLPDGRSRSVEAELASEPTTWREGLLHAAPDIQRAVQELGATNLAATVVYRSPTQGVGLESLAVGSDGEAEEAAILAVGDQLSYPSALADARAAVVEKDRDGRAVRTHVLVGADHDDTLSGIAYALRDCGLTLHGAVPRDALLMASTVAGGSQCPDGSLGFLRVGESASYLAVHGPTGLAFARRISIGLTTLVRAMVGSAAADDLELTMDEAAVILRDFGVPEADAEIDAARGIRGRQIRARLQSVLQRLVVELRQSLRFGLSETEREDFRLRLAGPGAALPGLAEVLASELELPVSIAENARYWPEPGRRGSDLWACVQDRPLLGAMMLLPLDESRTRRSRRYRRWLWTGAVAAMALVVMDGFRQHAILESVTREADVLRSTRAVHEALEATGRKLREAIQSMEVLETTIGREFGTRAPIDACLKEISLVLPKELRISRIDINASDGPVTGRLAGLAFESPESRNALPEFVDALRASPLFVRATLGDVSSVQVGDYDAMRFQVEFTAVPVPREDLPAVNVIAAAMEDAP